MLVRRAQAPRRKRRGRRFFSLLVGCSNIGDIVINAQKTSGLVDTGSHIISISESFYVSESCSRAR